MEVFRTFTGTPWEGKVGYCRALRVGRQVFISGTAPVDDAGGVFAPGDAGAQTARCLELIQGALHSLGADVTHVVRTRMFVTDISRWEEYGEAHRRFFDTHPPVTSMLEVKALIDPAMLIEIEVDAVIPEPAP